MDKFISLLGEQNKGADNVKVHNFLYLVVDALLAITTTRMRPIDIGKLLHSSFLMLFSQHLSVLVGLRCFLPSVYFSGDEMHALLG